MQTNLAGLTIQSTAAIPTKLVVASMRMLFLDVAKVIPHNAKGLIITLESTSRAG